MDVFLIICLEFPTVFVQTNPSPGFNAFLKGFELIKQKEVLWIIIVIRLLIRLLWLISTPTLMIGNRLEKTSYISWWQIFAMILIFYSALTSAYFLIVHSECGFLGNIVSWTKELQSEKPDETAGRDAAKFVVFLTLFDGAFLFFIPSIFFMVCVHLRSMDIKYHKREVRMLDSWTSYELTPYRIPRAKVASSLEGSHQRFSAPPSTMSTAAPISTLSRSQFFFENEGYEVDPDQRSHHRPTLPSSTIKSAFL